MPVGRPNNLLAPHDLQRPGHVCATAVFAANLSRLGRVEPHPRLVENHSRPGTGSLHPVAIEAAAEAINIAMALVDKF
jgi:hypothetical protein